MLQSIAPHIMYVHTYAWGMGVDLNNYSEIQSIVASEALADDITVLQRTELEEHSHIHPIEIQ